MTIAKEEPVCRQAQNQNRVTDICNIDCPAQSVKDHMSANGIDFQGDLLLDGKIHRFSSDSNKSKKDEWYVGNTWDYKGHAYATVSYGSWSNPDEKHTYKSWEDAGTSLSDDALKFAKKRLADSEKPFERASIQGYETAAQEVQKIWDEADEVAATSDEYSSSKNITPIGARYGAYYGSPSLLVPLYNAQRQMRSLQYIFKKDGKFHKRFYSRGEKKGCFHVIGSLEEAPKAFICEGYATSCSIHQSSQTPVVTSFDCGNLEAVVQVIQKTYPKTQLVIAADNDHQTSGNPGLTKGKIIAKKYGCSLVFPSFPDGSTGTDFNDLDMLSGEQTVQEQLQKSSWNFTVLGHTPSREVVIWYGGKVEQIKPSQIRHEDIKMLFGAHIDAKQCGVLKNQIIEQSRKKIIRLETPIKSGVWKFGEIFVIISGSNVIKIQNGNYQVIDEPVVGEKIVEFTDAWLDIKNFAIAYREGRTLSTIFSTVHSYISQWNWRHQESAEYVTAQLMLSIFQHAMRWRPWNRIHGPRGSAKTLLFEHIFEPLLGSLYKELGKTTAHALAQSVGNSGVVPILDEFEKYPKIDAILETCKLFNRGGTKTSGTPSLDPQKYRLFHSLWFANIYLPPSMNSDAAQKSRLLEFELLPPDKRYPKIPNLEGAHMRVDLVAAMLLHWEQIEQQAVFIENQEYRTSDGRLPDGRAIDNLSYAGALIKLATGKEFCFPTWMEMQTEDDGITILKTILNSVLDVPNDSNRPQKRTVAECIDLIATGSSSKNNADSAMKLSGLAYKNKALAIHPSTILQRKLLKNTPFESLEIGDPLYRLPGSTRKQVSMKNNKHKCIVVDLRLIETPNDSKSYHAGTTAPIEESTQSTHSTHEIIEAMLLQDYVTSKETIPQGTCVEIVSDPQDANVIKRLKQLESQGKRSRIFLWNGVERIIEVEGLSFAP